jgi:asparagine synthase (glutamine-hydrolysing)
VCGIAGIIDFRAAEDKIPILRGMIGQLQHRGPDASGVFVRGAAGLAHARLSIIDLSGGDQPIHNEDGSVWVAFNGEIFNYPELREDLEARGHRFYTRTDTETLVHLYEEKGEGFFNQLNGQFAFAIWDDRRQRLLLGRDRMGIRPLFYRETAGRLVFASEIKALFVDPAIPRRLDTQTISDVFSCWCPIGAKTAFEGITSLLPGHYAVFDEQGLDIRSYWRLQFPDAEEAVHQAQRPLESWLEELNHLLLDATRIRLRADVPVAAYLSGGLDSTFTSALVKRNFNNRLCTFSVGFSDPRFDESIYQCEAVAALATEHRECRCSEADIGEVFPRVVWHAEAPMLRTAPAPMFLLSRLVRRSSYKVVLTGEGADEIFAGYNIFKEDRVRRFWARRPESALRAQLITRLYPYIFGEQNTQPSAFVQGFFKRHLNRTDSPIYSHLLRWENTGHLKGFLSPDINKVHGGSSEFIERYMPLLPPEHGTWHPLSRAQFIEIQLFLSNYLLSSQGDRMAMAHAVEGRYPFLDYRVVELAARMPARYRLNGLTEKYILKKAAAEMVPRQIVERAKQPYRAPIGRCFFGERPPDYVAVLLSERALRRTGCFDPSRVSVFIEKCRKQEGRLLGERENMALTGILSIQLLDHLFIRRSAEAVLDFHPVRDVEGKIGISSLPDDVVIMRGTSPLF